MAGMFIGMSFMGTLATDVNKTIVFYWEKEKQPQPTAPAPKPVSPKSEKSRRLER